ncbi:MAG: S41 family peptidase [Petrimonas sp.]|uniref:S41 family peptidase n=1 Tax=Petrimonas sp. TaxID=2023866 RepID=UPI002B3C6955|nr:S41 family peptidase [Petrimonas sp.]
MKKVPFLLLIVLLTINVKAQTTQTDKNQRYFGINKSIDIFNSVIRELDMFYVDSIKVDSLINGTIRNMLARMDPYTEYYAEENIGDLQFMTTGEYGGIGSIISYNNNRVVINEPYKGLPADKAGLKAGDAILEIDGADMRKASVKEVSDKLKGTPGTTLKLKIQRPGENRPREITIAREKIEIDPVTYPVVLDDNVGYFHYSGFTNGSSNRVKETILDLKKKGAESLVIDLRGNGGGILDEAVNVVNFFVRKGLEIVSTKGKVKQWDRSYYTQSQPIDTLMPIVVLIDTGSASASEIVAGSLQDLDRAVIIGNRSFGKGLVQTPRDLPYGGNIKITTSKYYIPSGRCIQALDYSHRNPDGSVARVPDSLTHVFKTKNGREVRDGGGITPDYTIPQEKGGTIGYYLITENIIFDYATQWVIKHPGIASPESFHLSGADYEQFKQFVKTKDFQYDQMSNRSLQSLKNIMEFEGYFNTDSEEFKALEDKLQPDLDRDLELFKKEIGQMIETEIVQRYYYKEGVLIYELQDDAALKKAKEVLKDRQLYNYTLQPKPANIPLAKEL